jgi:hypothetical protein
LTCKTLNEEASIKFLEAYREYPAEQHMYWSNEYKAPILITDPVRLGDLRVTEVHLPQSMFTEEWQTQWSIRAMEQPGPVDDVDDQDPIDERFQHERPMSKLHLAHSKSPRIPILPIPSCR